MGLVHESLIVLIRTWIKIAHFSLKKIVLKKITKKLVALNRIYKEAHFSPHISLMNKVVKNVYSKNKNTTLGSA